MLVDITPEQHLKLLREQAVEQGVDFSLSRSPRNRAYGAAAAAAAAQAAAAIPTASSASTASASTATANSAGTQRVLQTPATTTSLPSTSRYTLSDDGRVRSRNGRRVDSLGNYARSSSVAPLPATTAQLGALGGIADPLAPTSLGGFIGAAYGGFQGGGNVLGPTGYNAFQQYVPGYDTGIGSLYAQSEQDFARTLAISSASEFWAEINQQQVQFEAQLRETILNNRRSQLLANIGVSGRNAAPTSRIDIR